MKKVLFTANLDSFFMKFLIPQLKRFKEMGYEVHVASKSENIDIPYCDKKFDVSFSRNFNLKENIESIKQMKKILSENDYELISCHTPFGGAIPRLAAKSLKNRKSKIVYTAHGFHFFKGAPLKNWIIYYSMEKYLSKYTDSIITINKEDYDLCLKKMKCKAYYIPGIGISGEKFDVKLNSNQKKELYKELDISEKSFVMIFPGEINDNKNQTLLIDMLKKLEKRVPNAVLLLPGTDLTNGRFMKYAEDCGVLDKVKFLGYRKDIPKLLNITNLSVSSSKREGLPINIIEALYVGLPVVATNCRGNRDLITNGENGYLIENFDSTDFADKVEKIYKDKKLYNKMSKLNKEKAKGYLIDVVLDDIMKIYER